MNENNTLLAQFLGWAEQKDPTERWFGSFRDFNGNVHKNTDREPLLFHSDWNFLMQVVEKIESLEEVIYFRITSYVEIQYRSDKGLSFIHIRTISKLEAVYQACVEFVKWYNENK